LAVVLGSADANGVQGHTQASQPQFEDAAQTTGPDPGVAVIDPQAVGATPAKEGLAQYRLQRQLGDIVAVRVGEDTAEQDGSTELIDKAEPADPGAVGQENHLTGIHLPDLVDTDSTRGRGILGAWGSQASIDQPAFHGAAVGQDNVAVGLAQ